MHITIGLVGEEIEDERIDQATRDLLREIRAEADPRASLVTREGLPGSKGDLVTLGQIALALVTGGAVGKFIECVFSFLGRNKKLQVEIVNASGRKMSINMDFIDKHGTERALHLAKDFLEKSG